MQLTRVVVLLSLLSISALAPFSARAQIERADAGSSDSRAATVRSEFQRAYANKLDAASDSAELRNYILYPYLQQQRLRAAIAGVEPNFSVIDRDAEIFLKQHDRAAVGAELRRVWFASLAQRKQWSKLLDNYRDVNDPTLQCHALSARVALQRFEGLAAEITAVWSSAADSRPACESPFNWLKTQAVYTPSLIEARARAALKAGNAAFARQIIAMLPASETERIDALSTWAVAIERPRQAIDAAIATPAKKIESDALFAAWTRFVRTDANGATQKYAQLVRARQFTPELSGRYALELALSLSWNRSNESLRYFSKVGANEMDERGFEWHARAALWDGDWELAAKIVEAMPESLRRTTKWKYWRSRTFELSGKTQAAREQYAGLLRDDNYYAALSAARLGVPYTPSPQFFPVDEQVLRRIADLPDFKRARELLLTSSFELRNFAYDEWRVGYAKLNPAARAQAAITASRWGWHDQAILTAAQQFMFDDYELLYPRPYDEPIKNAADIVSLPPALLYSVLRQESLYRVDAVSSAGAVGLMQLLPDTAAYTARRRPELTKLLREPNNLFNPTTSIYLGAAKLRDMIDRFDGKAAVALAAYNAGPTAARRWHPADKKEIDVWIENIPYNETRTYIQRIYWHSVVFGWLMTQESQSTELWLTTIGGK